MSAAVTCESCRWWKRGAPALATAARRPKAEQDLGACYLLPPVTVRTEHFASSMYPDTRGTNDGCGSHAPRAAADNVVAIGRPAA